MEAKAVCQLILDDFKNKKVYQPYKATLCDICGCDIEESDDFVFLSDKRKLCQGCLMRIVNYLESNIKSDRVRERRNKGI